MFPRHEIFYHIKYVSIHNTIEYQANGGLKSKSVAIVKMYKIINSVSVQLLVYLLPLVICFEIPSDKTHNNVRYGETTTALYHRE